MRTTESWQTRLIGASVLAALCGFSFNVQAERPHYRTELRAPSHLATCNDPDGFRDVLSLALPEPLLEPPITRVLEVRVDRLPQGGFVADVTTKELNGSVVATMHEAYPLETECFKVLHKVAVATSIWLNKLDGPLEHKPNPTPIAPPPAPPPVLRCPACEPPPPPPPKPAPNEYPWFAGLGGSTVLGAAPANVVGLQLTLGWKWARSWSIEGNVRGTFPATALPLETTLLRVHSILSFAVAPCYRLKAFGACVVVTGGNMWVEPLTLASSGVGTSQFLGVGPRVFVETRLAERWSLRVDADLVLPVMTNWIQDGPDPRWNSFPISGAANVSFAAWF